jgi:predicted outer membrane protein
MIETLAFLLLAAAQPPEQTTLPRQADTQPYETRDDAQGRPTDPLFDRKLIATDDATFIVAAVENGRQAVVDARAAQDGLANESLRGTAAAIGAQQEELTRKLEALAKRKGWRLPDQNAGRMTTLPVAGPHRASANFIVNQISAHQQALQQFRAQIAGKGDPELRKTLRGALPGYQKNLERLLEAKL